MISRPIWIGGTVILVAVLCTVAILYRKLMARPVTIPAPVALPSLDDIPPAQLQRLAETRVFFGHRSVGRNMLQGIEEVAAARGFQLNIVETCDPGTFDAPVLAHYVIGQNGDASSKIHDFARILDSGVGARVNAAFFKLCYVDIEKEADPDAVAEEYRTVVTGLRERHSAVHIPAITTPLNAWPSSPANRIKTFAKSLLRRPTVIDDNMARDRYNHLLKKEGVPGVFDLAMIESIDPQGRQHVVPTKQGPVPLLYGGYTLDGGHLNEAGRKHVAEQFLVFLAGHVSDGGRDDQH